MRPYVPSCFFDLEWRPQEASLRRGSGMRTAIVDMLCLLNRNEKYHLIGHLGLDRILMLIRAKEKVEIWNANGQVPYIT